MSTSPWPPPGTPPEPRPRPAEGYRSPIRIARLLRWTVTLWMLAAVLAVTTGYLQVRVYGHELAHPATVSAARLATTDVWRISLSRIVQVLALTCVCLLAGWTRRLYRNLEPLGVHRRFRRGWAVAGWFVPFVNLVRPKQIVDEIWKAGDPERRPGTHWQDWTVSPLLHFWWALWIVVVPLTPFLSRRTDDLTEGANSGYLLVSAGVCQLAFGILTLLVVARTTARQRHVASEDEANEARPGRELAPALVAIGVTALAATVAVNGLLVSNLPDRPAASVNGVGADLSPLPPGQQAAGNLRPGRCFNDPKEWKATQLGFVSVTQMELVACDTAHDNEVFALVRLPALKGGLYPGDGAVHSYARSECLAVFDEWVGIGSAASELEVSAVWPNKGRWRKLDDRSIACFAFRRDLRPLDGSVRGGGL